MNHRPPPPSYIFFSVSHPRKRDPTPWLLLLLPLPPPSLFSSSVSFPPHLNPSDPILPPLSLIFFLDSASPAASCPTPSPTTLSLPMEALSSNLITPATSTSITWSTTTRLFLVPSRWVPLPISKGFRSRASFFGLMWTKSRSICPPPIPSTSKWVSSISSLMSLSSLLYTLAEMPTLFNAVTPGWIFLSFLLQLTTRYRCCLLNKSTPITYCYKR